MDSALLSDLSWLTQPAAWVGLFTLIVLEIVLGVDNLVFIAILANKVKPEHRDRARVMGLTLAVVIRLIMLALMAHIIAMTAPWFYLNGIGVSVKDLIMLGGGLFLLYKATSELHERLEGQAVYSEISKRRTWSPLATVVAQIVLLDMVFSVDSVITAVAMVEHIVIAMAAVVVAMAAMILASKPLTRFVDQHPTVVMLCLGFLLMIGFSLIAEGLHFAIPKGYLYAAIGFSILIEIFNQISQKNTRKNAFAGQSWRHRTVDGVLGMMGIREDILSRTSRSDDPGENNEYFEENEKNMIRSVLTLAERAIPGVMIPRMDIERLDLSQSKEEQHELLKNTPFSRLIVVGKAGIDEPLGYINKKDLLVQLLSDEPLNINTALRQPLILPESCTALHAMELFRQQSADLALVVDEFGAVLGMVTMKDLFEAIAGEFPEEYERSEAPLIHTETDHSLIVDGSLEYTHLAQQIALPPLGEDSDYHTVAGLMMEEMQSIPEVGESMDFYDWRFTVLEKDGQRIERIRIIPVPHQDQEV